MTLSESIAALAANAQALAPQVAAVESQVSTLQTERAAAVEALDVLMILAQEYLAAPNGEDADEADALQSFLAAHQVP